MGRKEKARMQPWGLNSPTAQYTRKGSIPDDGECYRIAAGPGEL